MNFLEHLNAAWRQNDSLLCIGLDSELKRIPEHLHSEQHPLFEFNKQIIDATCDLVCAFKPQIAFYSAVGAEDQLEMTTNYIAKKYPQLLIILDAKRADIGNTARLYASEAFDRYKADAVTVNPYMGLDSLEPFLERQDKGVAILARTSNPGARDLQDLKVNGQPIYKIVSQKAAMEWNFNHNVMLVVGATYPKELAEIRSCVGNTPFLVPGIGAQGGDIEATITSGIDSCGKGMVINSSRAIIYASSDANFAQAARQAAQQTKEQINRFRTSVKI